MIKNFETYINEDYFSKLANRKDTGIVRKENEITLDVVRSIIDLNYCDDEKIKIRKENNEIFVDAYDDIFLKYDIEEIPFQFGDVIGDFVCSYTNLKNLKGCPLSICGDFKCCRCKNLTSLEGCPKKVDGDFYCYGGPKDFSEMDIKSLCNVKGIITV